MEGILKNKAPKKERRKRIHHVTCPPITPKKHLEESFTNWNQPKN
jgi:hypothetical protein